MELEKIAPYLAHGLKALDVKGGVCVMPDMAVFDTWSQANDYIQTKK